MQMITKCFIPIAIDLSTNLLNTTNIINSTEIKLLIVINLQKVIVGKQGRHQVNRVEVYHHNQRQVLHDLLLHQWRKVKELGMGFGRSREPYLFVSGSASICTGGFN